MLVVMRGIPGAGKTYHTKKLMGQHLQQDGATGLIVSADDYHVDADTGAYKYKPELAGVAHSECFRSAHEFLRKNRNDKKDKHLLIVDNTNIHAWEFQPYVMVAQLFGHRVLLKLIWCSLEDALVHGTHNVPHTVLLRMWKELDPPTPGHSEKLIRNFYRD